MRWVRAWLERRKFKQWAERYEPAPAHLLAMEVVRGPRFLPELEFTGLTMKEQERIINEIAMSIEKHPDLVTAGDIARWEVADESF